MISFVIFFKKGGYKKKIGSTKTQSEATDESTDNSFLKILASNDEEYNNFYYYN